MFGWVSIVFGQMSSDQKEKDGFHYDPTSTNFPSTNAHLIRAIFDEGDNEAYDLAKVSMRFRKV